MQYNKVLLVGSKDLFVKELPKADEPIDSIHISGYASVNIPDRKGDVIPSSVWEKGVENFLKNPVVLGFHKHSEPIGRVVEHKIDDKGLWVRVRVSAAAEDTFNLIKDGVVTAFSVGILVKDAEYKPEAELFIIKKLELVEISVVSVPCHQDTLFTLSKSFTDQKEYELFKTQFGPQSEAAKGLATSSGENSNTIKENFKMDPKVLQDMLDAAATRAAEAAAKAINEKSLAEAKALEEKSAAEAALQKRIDEAISKIQVGKSGTEKLLEEVTSRFEAQNVETKKTIEGLEAVLKEKAAELTALQKSKMTFSESMGDGKIPYADIEKAVLLSKVTRKSIEDTKFGQSLLVKYAGSQPSPRLPNATWDTEVSTNMEADIRRRLVIAGSFTRSVNMDQPVMKIPLNPDASGAGWVTNTQYGSSASAGPTTQHAISEIVLSAYKLANNEYLAYEEDEDSLIVLLPLVRDAMVRRLARGVDKAFGLGIGSGSDPVKGLAKYDDISAVTLQVASTFSTAQLRALRKDLGVWGLDPSEVVFIVNTEAYYDLMEDALFQTMDKVGDKATILTGQVGMVGGSPVIVSGELPAKVAGANTGGNVNNVGAIAFNAANFLVGNQRGVRFDTQDLVETQRKVLVGSLRTGMTQVTTTNGLGVSAFRWLT